MYEFSEIRLTMIFDSYPKMFNIHRTSFGELITRELTRKRLLDTFRCFLDDYRSTTFFHIVSSRLDAEPDSKLG